MKNDNEETLEEIILRNINKTFNLYKEASSNLIKQGEADNLVRRILSLTIEENNT